MNDTFTPESELPLVIYHSADFDGLFSREVCRLKFGTKAQYLGWDYGDPVPDVSHERDLIIVDLSIHELMDHPRLTWIDHHVSAINRYTKTIPGLRLDGVAACRLAYQYFFGFGSPTHSLMDYRDRLVIEPIAVRLAGEYDVWDHRDPDVMAFQYGLRSVELSPREWRSLVTGMYFTQLHADLIKDGRIVKYVEEKGAERKMRNSFTLEWAGLKFLAVNGSGGGSRSFASRVKSEHDALLQFSYDGSKRLWYVSMYAAEHSPASLDLTKISVKYGGGGHARACGFTTPQLPFQI
jgi:oligoribonuclease NrnB/cAMP/cGMP phosphodiesterase (DHH superfamily)